MLHQVMNVPNFVISLEASVPPLKQQAFLFSDSITSHLITWRINCRQEYSISNNRLIYKGDSITSGRNCNCITIYQTSFMLNVVSVTLILWVWGNLCSWSINVCIPMTVKDRKPLPLPCIPNQVVLKLLQIHIYSKTNQIVKQAGFLPVVTAGDPVSLLKLNYFVWKLVVRPGVPNMFLSVSQISFMAPAEGRKQGRH